MKTPESKQEYKKLLEETIAIVEKHFEDNNDSLNKVLLEQLKDLKICVVELGVLTEWYDINERYSIGGIAVKNFDEDDEMYRRLTGIFDGALNYRNLI